MDKNMKNSMIILSALLLSSCGLLTGTHQKIFFDSTYDGANIYYRGKHDAVRGKSAKKFANADRFVQKRRICRRSRKIVSAKQGVDRYGKISCLAVHY